MVVMGIFVLLALSLDQVSKWLVMRKLGAQGSLTLLRFFRLRTVLNAYRRPGLLWSDLGLIVLWAAAVLSPVVLAKTRPFLTTALPQIGLGVALGGAAGNLVDRLWRGAVVDFIDLRVWPVFNLADAAIVLGVGAFLAAATFHFPR